MQHERDTLGSCPECGESILSVDVLIEYETPAGVDRYAECRRCETVVHPE